MIFSSLGLVKKYVYENRYLEPGTIDYQSIPLPPVGDADAAELKKMLEITKVRTKEDCVKFRYLGYRGPKNFFNSPEVQLTKEELAKYQILTEGELAKYDVLLWEAHMDLLKYLQVMNEFKPRNTPNQRHKEIILCAGDGHSRSYPSKTAASAWLWSKILSMAYPSNKDQLIKRAEEISELIMKSGEAHPSDLVAGKILAEKIFEALLLNKEFLSDFKNPMSREEFNERIKGPRK